MSTTAVPESIPAIPEEVAADFLALPPDARYAAAQFIAFLRRQAKPTPARRVSRRVPLRDDPAIGQWRDRADMEDSVAYVRELRRKQWGGNP